MKRFLLLFSQTPLPPTLFTVDSPVDNDITKVFIGATKILEFTLEFPKTFNAEFDLVVVHANRSGEELVGHNCTTISF